MPPQHTIVIPYTRISTLEKIVRDVLSRPENAGATLRLVRTMDPCEMQSDHTLAEHLYSEFKALQVLTQRYDCRLTIELQPHAVERAQPLAEAAD